MSLDRFLWTYLHEAWDANYVFTYNYDACAIYRDASDSETRPNIVLIRLTSIGLHHILKFLFFISSGTAGPREMLLIVNRISKWISIHVGSENLLK